MKILHLIASFGGGGAERQLARISAAQRAAGHEVHVGVLSAGVHMEQVERSGTVVHLLEHTSHYDFGLIRRIVELTREMDADVVQTWLPLMDVVGGIGARWAGRKWILSERSAADAYPGVVKFRLRAFMGRWADAIVANSPAGCEYWTKRGVQRSRCFVIPNALDLSAIDATQGREATTDTPPGKFILFAGRMLPVKNLDVILDAFALALPSRGARALMCGDGPEADRVQKGIERRGLSDYVTLSPFRADLWPVLHKASGLILVSKYEGCPNVVLEAMGANCPVVVSDIPAHRAILNESQALFVPAKDAVAAASALMHILDDDQASSVRAERARAAVEKYQPDEIARRLHDVYVSIGVGPR